MWKVLGLVVLWGCVGCVMSAKRFEDFLALRVLVTMDGGSSSEIIIPVELGTKFVFLSERNGRVHQEHQSSDDHNCQKGKSLLVTKTGMRVWEGEDDGVVVICGGTLSVEIHGDPPSFKSLSLKLKKFEFGLIRVEELSEQYYIENADIPERLRAMWATWPRDAMNLFEDYFVNVGIKGVSPESSKSFSWIVPLPKRVLEGEENAPPVEYILSYVWMGERGPYIGPNLFRNLGAEVFSVQYDKTEGFSISPPGKESLKGRTVSKVYAPFFDDGRTRVSPKFDFGQVESWKPFVDEYKDLRSWRQERDAQKDGGHQPQESASPKQKTPSEEGSGSVGTSPTRRKSSHSREKKERQSGSPIRSHSGEKKEKSRKRIKSSNSGEKKETSLES